ncbi:hybrid sensor histidine kinase/response regulator transcription factor [Marinoscillum sp.]|uniref:hybrid sensor histidine kinase/response regulator transcription factor n=1 Tax=Marinoscillum sp. TaxID=2024838 RepID=UPI003BAA078F
MFRSQVYITLLALILLEKSQANDLKFHKITTSDGLSHNTVYTIEQDHKGFMWFGTREGLNRFDSEEIVTYYHRKGDSLSLNSNHITALESGLEALYVGTPVGLSRYIHKSETFEHCTFDGASMGHISRIYISNDSAVYVSSNKGLYVRRVGSDDFVCLISGANVVDFIEYRKGIFWVSTLQSIRMINIYGETIRQFGEVRMEDGKRISLQQNVSCLYKDQSGIMWIGTRKNGLIRYNEDQDLFTQSLAQHDLNPLEVNIVRSLSDDELGRIWIGTESGLLLYDPVNRSFERFSQDFSNPQTGLSDKAVYSIHRSREGIMWVGTYFGGVNMVRLRDKGFNKIMADGGKERLSGKAVSQISQVSDKELWIGTEDGGITIWDRQEHVFKYLRNQPGKNGLSVDNVHEIYKDSNGDVWIGTFLGGLNKYNHQSGRVEVYKSEGTNNFLNNMVYAVHRDAGQRLWVGTQAGLNLFDEQRQTYDLAMPETFAGKFVYEIYEDRNDGLWFCVNNLDSIYYLDNQNQLNKYHYITEGDEVSGSIGVISALEDRDGTMWFGTNNYGLLHFNPATQLFSNYTIEDGLPNNYVYGIIQEDSSNALWISTNKGLSRFDPNTTTFFNFNISHGLPNNQFNFKSAFKDKSGTMYFGTINGLCYFHPDSLMVNTLAPEVYFSDLKLFNKSVPVGAESLLSQSINATSTLELDYSQNVITLEFAAINYFSLGNNNYAYYLEGFEDDWNYVGNKKSATYTNLSPGAYTFKVKAANNDGVWSNDTREISLLVHPPFWKSDWALLIYVLMIAGLFLAYRMFLNYRNRERMAIQIERLEREKITEINQHKINFFTNISHEFKTPLTLIIASIDKFLLGKKDTEYSADYKSIKRNAKRLQFLIEQLMEFRKIESDHAKINYSQGDLVVYLMDTLNAFKPMFLEKGIDSHFTTSHESYIAFFDSDKMEKVVTNLISNAIKHTDAQGHIDLEVTFIPDDAPGQDLMKMIISDTGHGMASEEIDKIFAPFYQVDKGKQLQTGSGIGLALVKGLVDFMGGKIDVESNLHRGTYITITLPLEQQPKQEVIRSVEGNKRLDMEHELVSNELEGMPREMNSQYEIMLVEDNEEIIRLLQGHFSSSYKIYTATNGVEALKKLKKNIPDVIISDVMMPEMDGYEFCKEVKSNLETSHIPVILLTAKGSAESRMHGLDIGADLYIPKPFNLAEVDLRVKNLLDHRQKLHRHFMKFANVGEDIELSLNNRDQEFLSSLKQIVEDHLEESNFNITTFTQEAGVSRTLLHLKLKKLANLSASEFVKTIRLQRAAQYLEKSDLTVSEIAYKVGYGDPNYFTRSFREKFGVSPTEYKQKEKEAVD